MLLVILDGVSQLGFGESMIDSTQNLLSLSEPPLSIRTPLNYSGHLYKQDTFIYPTFVYLKTSELKTSHY